MTGLRITDLNLLLNNEVSINDVIPIVDISTDTLKQIKISDLPIGVKSFVDLTNKPTTIGGYGITDAYTVSQVDTILQAYQPNISYAGSTSDGMLRSIDWVTFNNKADNSTTLSGYGIADAYTKTQIDTTFSGYTNTANLNTLLSNKQNTLVSNSNIKTINGLSILGSGDIPIASSSINSITFIAVSNQTAFVCGFNLVKPLVFLNGVLQLYPIYSISGNTITFSESRVLYDSITVVNFSNMISNNLIGNALFYGGSNGSNLNICTLISSTATLVQPETNAGTGRFGLAGANVGINALFYGGVLSNTCTLLSPTATLVQAESNIGLARSQLAGVSSNINALFYAGGTTVYDNTVTILSPICILVQAESNIGLARSQLAGSISNINSLFYSGWTGTYTNTCTLLSSTATLVQAESNIGLARSQLAGVSVSYNTNALFYGGIAGTFSNTCTILSPTCALVQAEITVGVNNRFGLAGANVGINALFYGGVSSIYLNTSTMLSSIGVLVQAESTVGSARAYLAGVSI